MFFFLNCSFVNCCVLFCQSKIHWTTKADRFCMHRMTLALICVRMLRPTSVSCPNRISTPGPATRKASPPFALCRKPHICCYPLRWIVAWNYGKSMASDDAFERISAIGKRSRTLDSITKAHSSCRPATIVTWSCGTRKPEMLSIDLRRVKFRSAWNSIRTTTSSICLWPGLRTRRLYA